MVIKRFVKGKIGIELASNNNGYLVIKSADNVIIDIYSHSLAERNSALALFSGLIQRCLRQE